MKDYQDKTHADLASLLAEKRAAHRTFRFGSTGGKAKNVKEGKSLKKDMARIMTSFSARKNEAGKAEKNKRMK
jgi:ribosomal protein L29